MLANLVVDLFIPKIRFGAKSDFQASIQNIPGVIVGVARYRRDRRLHGRQPEWEATGKMLDQDAKEALKGAEDGAMEQLASCEASELQTLAEHLKAVSNMTKEGASKECLSVVTTAMERIRMIIRL